MGACAFERDTIVKMDGAEYRLLRKIDADKWQLEALRSGELLQIRHEELLGRLADRTLAFSSSADQTRTPLPVDLSPKKHEIAVEMLAYVTAARKGSKGIRELEEVSKAVSKQINSPRKRPSASTIRRWDRALRNANEDYRILVDNHQAKGNRSRRYPAEVLTLCELSIQSKYLRRERNTIKITLDDAVLRVNEANRLRPSSMALPPPTRRLLTRMAQRISSYDRHAARYGREFARKIFRSVKGHVITDAPLERVEIDHTQLDLTLVDERTGQSIGRPYITAAIDDYTRCVLGIYIGFVHPSYQSVQECLKHCLTARGASS